MKIQERQWFNDLFDDNKSHKDANPEDYTIINELEAISSYLCNIRVSKIISIIDPEDIEDISEYISHIRPKVKDKVTLGYLEYMENYLKIYRL